MLMAEAVAQRYQETEGAHTLAMIGRVLPADKFAQHKADAAQKYVAGGQIPQHMAASIAEGLSAIGIRMTAFSVGTAAEGYKTTTRHFVPAAPTEACDATTAAAAAAAVADEGAARIQAAQREQLARPDAAAEVQAE